jgi:hypothetical protein
MGDSYQKRRLWYIKGKTELLFYITIATELIDEVYATVIWQNKPQSKAIT